MPPLPLPLLVTAVSRAFSQYMLERLSSLHQFQASLRQIQHAHAERNACAQARLLETFHAMTTRAQEDVVRSMESRGGTPTPFLRSVPRGPYVPQEEPPAGAGDPGHAAKNGEAPCGDDSA